MRWKMKWERIYSIFFGLVIIFILFTPGCKKCEGINPNAVGTLLQYEGCKQTGASTAWEGIGVSNNEDCIEYSYNGQTLTLKHINSAFNCCPGKITADIDINGNMISISEHEREAGCLCLCLFDLDYEIKNLQPGKYTIIINQLYLDKNDQVLKITLQLSSETSGTFCQDRNQYPWGQ